MNKFITILFCALFLACSNNDSCFVNTDKTVTTLSNTLPFQRIDIPKGVEVEIATDTVHKIEITTPKNTIQNINYEVVNNKLILTNNNTCSLLQQYKNATIKIYSPNIDTIYSRTQFKVYSNTPLTYPKIYILTSVDNQSASSEINLKLNNNHIVIEDNLVAYYTLEGKTNTLDIRLYGGNPKVDAKNLIAENVYIFHRSSQDVSIYPIQKVEGTLYSTGNLLMYNTPPIVNVQTLYKGMVLNK